MKFIQGDKALLTELTTNLFNMICADKEGVVNGVEYIEGQNGDGDSIKIDEDVLNPMQLMVIEAGMYSRIQAGVFPADGYEINEAILQNCFALTAGSQERYEIVRNDILRGAKVPDEQIFVLQQPLAPKMYNTLCFVVIAVNLNDDQMKAIQLSTKVAQKGVKITAFTKKASMIATSSTNVINRVGKEVTLAGVEVGATIGVGAVKTGVEATACVANIAIRDLNPKELAKGDNVQSLMKTLNGLFKKDKDQQTLTRGFGAL